MMSLRSLWIASAFVLACCGPPPHAPTSASPPPLELADAGATASPEQPADASADAMADAADPSLGCISNDDARAACEASGAGFYYGAPPFIYCRGIPPRGDEQARHAEHARTQPCVCNDEHAIAQRREQCSRVP